MYMQRLGTFHEHSLLLQLYQGWTGISQGYTFTNGASYLNEAITLSISKTFLSHLSTANDDCSSFTACRRPIIYGHFFISYFLYQVWLAHSIRHLFLHQSSLAYQFALKIASKLSLPRRSRAPFAPRHKAWNASVQAIVRWD